MTPYAIKSLSENRCCFQRDDGELKVQEADVVGGIFSPTGSGFVRLVEPRMCAFGALTALLIGAFGFSRE